MRQYRCREYGKLGGKMREIWLKDEVAIWYADCCMRIWRKSQNNFMTFQTFFLPPHFFAVSNIVAKCFFIFFVFVYKLCLFAISFCDLIFHIQYIQTHTKIWNVNHLSFYGYSFKEYLYIYDGDGTIYRMCYILRNLHFIKL